MLEITHIEMGFVDSIQLLGYVGKGDGVYKQHRTPSRDGIVPKIT